MFPKRITILQYGIIAVWICNCLLASFIAIKEVWIPYMSAETDAYIKIQSDPFD